MKYTIFGFSQQAVLDLNESTGAGIDITDLQIIDWFVDFFAGTMDKRQIGENVYGWVLARKVCEEFPLLGLKEQAVRKRLKKLVDAGVLESKVIKNKQDGTKAFYRLTAVGASLRYDSTDTEIHTRIYDDTHHGIYDGTNPAYTTVYDKDSPSSNPPIINPPIKREERTRTKKEPRHKYGEYSNVLLSDTDLAKLKEEFPADWEERIEHLSTYMESKGVSYKNHLATIRNWARRDREAKRNTVSRETTSGFDKKIDGDYYYQSTGDEEVDKVLGLGKYAPKDRANK